MGLAGSVSPQDRGLSPPGNRLFRRLRAAFSCLGIAAIDHFGVRVEVIWIVLTKVVDLATLVFRIIFNGLSALANAFFSRGRVTCEDVLA